MRKHLSKKLQAVALIVLVGWALDGHVPGLNEPVAPDPAPLPMAEHVENAVEQVLQVAEGVQVQTQQLIEKIQKKSVTAAENLVLMATQMQQTGQDIVEALPPLSAVHIPDLPELPELAQLPELPQLPDMPELPMLDELSTMLDSQASPELANTNQNGNILPLEDKNLPPAAPEDHHHRCHRLFALQGHAWHNDGRCDKLRDQDLHHRFPDIQGQGCIG